MSADRRPLFDPADGLNLACEAPHPGELRLDAGGAALIMTGVFVAFALAPIISMRELGIGLTVAVLLDATVIRLILLPATMRLAGDRIWWLPGWMERMFGEERRAPGVEPELARVRRLAG